MSDEERVLDKEHEWDFIVAGWPQEVQEADKELLALEQSLEDMLEVAIQQTVSRCKCRGGAVHQGCASGGTD